MAEEDLKSGKKATGGGEQAKFRQITPGKDHAVVVNGQEVVLFDAPKKVHAKSVVVLPGYHLNVYDRVFLRVGQNRFAPINLHRAYGDTDSISFLIPDFDHFMKEGDPIWVELVSLKNPVANGYLFPYVTYTMHADEKDEADKKEESEGKKKAGEEKLEPGKNLGLTGIAVAATGEAMSGLLQTGPGQQRAAGKETLKERLKKALKSGDRKAIEELVGEAKTNKDTAALQESLGEAGGSFEQSLLEEALGISDFRPKAVSEDDLLDIPDYEPISEDEEAFLDAVVSGGAASVAAPSTEVITAEVSDEEASVPPAAGGGATVAGEVRGESQVDRTTTTRTSTQVSGKVTASDKQTSTTQQKVATSVRGGGQGPTVLSSESQVTGQPGQSSVSSQQEMGIENEGRVQNQAQVSGEAEGENQETESLEAPAGRVVRPRPAPAGRPGIQIKGEGPSMGGQIKSSVSGDPGRAAPRGKSVQVEEPAEPQPESGGQRIKETLKPVPGAAGAVSASPGQPANRPKPKPQGSESEPETEGAEELSELPEQKPATAIPQEGERAQEFSAGAKQVAASLRAKEMPGFVDSRPGRPVRPGVSNQPGLPKRPENGDIKIPKTISAGLGMGAFEAQESADQEASEEVSTGAGASRDPGRGAGSPSGPVERTGQETTSAPEGSSGNGTGPQDTGRLEDESAASLTDEGGQAGAAMGTAEKLGPEEEGAEIQQQQQNAMSQALSDRMDKLLEDKKLDAEIKRVIKEANVALDQLLMQGVELVWASSELIFPIPLGALIGDFLWLFKKSIVEGVLKPFLRTEALKKKGEEIAKQIKISAKVKLNIVAWNLITAAAILLLLLLLFIFLWVGCNYPPGITKLTYKLSVIGALGGSSICESIDNMTSNFSFAGGDSGGAGASDSWGSPDGLLSTNQWTSQINQAAAQSSVDACILRVVVQKESTGQADIIGCDCAANGKPQLCPAGARGKYYPGYPFNWDQCSYGIGLTQWTIYPRSSSQNWNRWENQSTPSRNLFNDKYYYINDFLDPQTSLNLTARAFKNYLSQSGGSVAGAFRAYMGPGAPQSWVDQRMALYNMCKGSGGQP